MTIAAKCKKSISYIGKASAKFRDDMRFFTLSIACWRVLAFLFAHCGPLRTGSLCVTIHDKKHEAILTFLRNTFKTILESYARETETSVRSHCQRIWVCWFQGEENAPEIVKMCIESMRVNAGGREVVIITEDNYADYVSIPPKLLDKYNMGTITKTHFSDLLRFALLAEHGGLWLDSTVFCSKGIPKSYFDYSVFSCRNSNDPAYSTYVSKWDWSGFIIGGQANSLLFRYLRDVLFAYYERYDVLVDYLLFDYFISLGRAAVPAIRAVLDAVPQNNTNCHELVKFLNCPFNCKQFDKLMSSDTVFYKLSYKAGYQSTTTDGYPTVYTILLKGWEKQKKLSSVCIPGGEDSV